MPLSSGCGHFQVLVMTSGSSREFGFSMSLALLPAVSTPATILLCEMSNYSITCDKGFSKAALPSLDHTVTMVTPTCCSDPSSFDLHRDAPQVHIQAHASLSRAAAVSLLSFPGRYVNSYLTVCLCVFFNLSIFSLLNLGFDSS